MKRFLKVTVILIALGVFLSSCVPPDTPEVEVGSGCIDFKEQTHQIFPGPDFTINPLLFINPTDPQSAPIEINIEDHDNDGISELNIGFSSSGGGYAAMQVFFLSESFPNGVEIASVTLMHFHHADIIALDDDGSQQDVASALTQSVLTTLVVEGGSKPIRSMEWDIEETYVYKVCWGAEAVEQELSTEVVEPSEIHITFDALPDGTTVTTDLFLAGDEFGSQGVTLAGSPGPEEFADPPYCTDAIAVAIHQPPRYGVTTNFLTAVRPGEIDKCNFIPIKFPSPILFAM